MLYLVQHGEAVSKEVDPDRPLSSAGNNDVNRMATFMKSAGFGVDRVLHSGKTRARQTAEIFAKSICESGATEAVAGISPNDPVEDFITQVEQFSTPVMIVGHLPFMAKLVSKLVIDSDAIAIVDYQPGSVVCLGRVDDKHWSVRWMLRPELLT